MCQHGQMRLTCFAHAKIPGIDNPDAQRDGFDPHAVWDVPIEFALEYAWPSDVHIVQYQCATVNEIEMRLTKDCIDEIHPVMQVLIGDIDAPGHKRTDEWTAEIEPKLEACPYTYYRTRNGYRIVVPLAETFTIDSPARAAEWAARYVAWCDEIERDHGLVLDRACSDWTRIMRAPNVVRDGRVESSAVRWTGATAVLPPPKPGASKPKRTRAAGAKSDALAKAHAIAERMPPSVEGHGGDDALFRATREIATVVADAEAIERVLSETFNPRCLPPWPDAKLEYEARRAAEAHAKIAVVRNALSRNRPATDDDEDDADDADADGADADEDRTLEVAPNGKPIASLTNASRMLEMWFGAGVWLDDTTGEIVCDGFDGDNFPEGGWTNVHNTSFRLACEQHQLRLPKAIVEESVEKHAHRYRKNPVREELERLAETWDGTPRVDTALHRYWGCDDTPATRAASRVFHLGMAARGLNPGEKVDTVLILCGGQGAMKSTWLEIMAGGADRVNDAPISIGERDGNIALRGKWLVELTELESVTRKKDIAAVKAWVTIRVDRYRPLYERYTRSIPRTCVFVGTSNETEILRDDTGERRWMPVTVRALDRDAVRRDRDQIVAEAAARVIRGEQIYPTAEERAVLAGNAEEYKEAAHPWDAAIEAWVARKIERNDAVTIAELIDANGPVPLPADRRDRAIAVHVSAALRRLGFARSRKRIRGRITHVYSRPRPPEARDAPEARAN